MIEANKHCVAIFGGAVSGAEAAMQFVNRGIHVVLFEQNPLPYGKIEDGLPKWHAKLRDKEEKRIDEKLDNELVHYVPCVKLGRDIQFKDLTENWGFSAVLLAIGAWRDRPINIKNIDEYINKGLYYQNSFFKWFNHYHESGYTGPQLNISDNAIIIGGGLASIDVAKAVMMYSVENALHDKGISVNLFDLERGLENVLEKHQLSLEDLDINGCTLYYRRRVEDMPLATMPGNSPEVVERIQQTRVKILSKAQQNFHFKFKELHSPKDIIVKDGKLNGLIFNKTMIEDNRVVPIEGSEYEVESPLVISSIGSLPERVNGIPTQNQVFKVSSQETSQLEGYDNVFVIGNAVTGKGNIRYSMQHSQEMSKKLMDDFLEWQEQDFQDILRDKENDIEKNMKALADVIIHKNVPSAENISKIENRVKQFREQSGYNGNYRKWIKHNTPKRLEEII